MTTQNLRLVIRWLDRPIVIVFAVINVMVVVAVAASVGRYSPEQVIATLPTPSLPIIIIATAPPLATPAAQISSAGANITQRALVAYDAPDGRALGAIEQGRAYRVLAGYGVGWLQADVTGSGVVWLRAADLLGVPGGLVDLAPTATAAVVERSIVVYANPTPAQTWDTPTDAPPLSKAGILRDHFLAGREP